MSAAWRLPDVLSLLHAQVERSGVGAVLAGGGNPSGLGQLSGYFALVCLSRFLTKLGDYGGALDALRPLKIFSTDGTTYGRIPKAHISVQYYAAFALMMARAYEDAFRVLHRALALFQRLHNVLGDRDREPSGGAHVQKTAEKMLALLALCVAVLPSASVDEIVRRPLRERFAEPMERVTAGDAAEVEALFAMAAPGYFAWAPAAPAAAGGDAAAAAGAADGDGDAGDTPSAAFNFHLAQLQKDVAQRTGGFGGLRAFLRLYTNIDLGKLAEGAAMTNDEVRCVRRARADARARALARCWPAADTRASPAARCPTPAVLSLPRAAPPRARASQLRAHLV